MKFRIATPMNVVKLQTVVCCFLCMLSFMGTSALALSPDEARHLLGRTGFGAAPKEIATLLPMSREQAVDHLMAQMRPKPFLAAPPVLSSPRPNYSALDPEADRGYNEFDHLQHWWIDEMISTPTAMTERMVLFWHNHFTSKILSGGATLPMYDQLQLFRRYAAGDLRKLLRELVRDPMMLTFLNNIDNRRAKPNENLAREFLELFTLGPGNYTETDVKALARVLTGHEVNRTKGWVYQYNANNHDNGPVEFLGHRGTLDIDAAIDIILKKPASAEFIARKFWREFVKLDPSQAEVQASANVLQEADFQIAPMLRNILISDSFWAPEQRGALPKSPIDLVVGFARSFGVMGDDAYVFAYYASVLGQTLMDPPNVAGWPGGMSWLNSASLPRMDRVIDRMWGAYLLGKQVSSHPTTAGLRIRLSSEYMTEQGLVRILVNDRVVHEHRLTRGIDLANEPGSSGVGYIKPPWEQMDVPRSKLPAKIRTVAVQLMNSYDDDKPDGKGANVFVNWIQIDGERFPAHRGRRIAAIPDNATPLGMMYSNEILQFDVPALRRFYQRSKADLVDLDSGPNETVEVSTSKVVSTLLPPAHWSELEAFKVDDDEYLRQFVLPVAPMRSIRTTAMMTQSPMARARSLTHDPAYLLK